MVKRKRMDSFLIGGVLFEPSQMLILKRIENDVCRYPKGDATDGDRQQPK